MTYDLVIIGSGPGGYKAAEYAAKNGLQVAIVEAADAGGTCLNCGCIPTKSLCHDATQAASPNGGRLEGWGGTVASPNGGRLEGGFKEAMQRKQAIVEQLRAGVEQLMSQPGITFIRGRATLKSPHTVEVTPTAPLSSAASAASSVCGDAIATSPVCCGFATTLEASHIIIATGSSPKLPPIKGIDLPCVVTSTELLNLDHVPERLAIIGAGVIGMEFASIFNAFGSKVTVIEYLKECLPAMDSDIAKRLRKSLEKRGIEFFMQSAVTAITPDAVHFTRKGKEQTVEADIVLVATGRKPNTEGLGLETIGAEVGRNGIAVDPATLQLSSLAVPLSSPEGASLYAIGDVNGLSMLAHAATYQGYRAVNHILGRKDNIRLDIMPAAVFTTPEAAGVGLTEDQCKEQGLDYAVHKSYYRANGKALAMDATDGLVKIITQESTPKDSPLGGNERAIIGCHVLGAHAADLVQEVAALMNLGITLDRLRDIIHIHPTLSELLPDAAER